MEHMEQCGRGNITKKLLLRKNSTANRLTKKCFIKEARLMFSLKHDNIVSFKAFLTSPCAIMMEYMCFNFSLFEISKELSNLADFLNFVDKIDGFGCFANDLIPKMGHEISKGIVHRCIVHRDLKAKNILVSNQHYCNLSDEKTRFKTFSERLIACKLADFGEGRPHLIQTAAALHSRTKNVDR